MVNALNADMPFDEFTIDQVAGDLLPTSGDPARDHERIVATGFLSLGAKMLAEDDPVKMEMDIIDEQLDTLGATFMGLTLGCARCHDHKFDPIPTADYYSLYGVFASSPEAKDPPALAAPGSAAICTVPSSPGWLNPRGRASGNGASISCGRLSAGADGGAAAATGAGEAAGGGAAAGCGARRSERSRVMAWTAGFGATATAKRPPSLALPSR